MTSPDWPVLPLKRVATVKLGKMVQTEPSGPDDVEAPYLRAAHVQPNGRIADVEGKTMWFRPGELGALNLRSGDVVVVEGGAGYGRSSTLTADMPGWGFQNSINRVRPIAGAADGRFIDYALQHSLRSGQTELLVNTATIPHFTAEKVAAVRAPFPDLTEQRAIADFLDRETAQIDAMIDAQERLVALLEERRVAVISRFVVGGAMSAIMKDSGVPWIGQVPAHWEVGRLKNSIESATNGVWGDDPTGDDNDVLCARVTDFDRRRLKVQASVPTVRSVSYADRVSRGLRRGDLLLEKSGGTHKNPVGFVVLYDSDEPAVCSNFIARLRLRAGMDPRYWTYAHAASYAVRLTQRSVKQSTGIQNLDQGSYFEEYFPYPPSDEQARIADQLDAATQRIDVMIAKAQESIALMKERRAAVISAAVTGRIDVRTGIEQVERDLEEARV